MKREKELSVVQKKVKHGLDHQASLFKGIFRFFLKKILVCANPSSYSRLERIPSSLVTTQRISDSGFLKPPHRVLSSSGRLETDENKDKIVLKMVLLGDCYTGKTTFMVKYASPDFSGENSRQVVTDGGGALNMMKKTLPIRRDTQITYHLCEVSGRFPDQIPAACQDAAAVFIIFDLTSRSTLNSVIDWYRLARQCNQTSMLVLVGTKFDEFVSLPLDLQWQITNQARVMAHAMHGMLLFSSATHNINVNKTFKLITAKLFDLPCHINRNLKVGEPIIDF